MLNKFLYFFLVSLALSSSIDSQQDLAVTIYDDFAMVKDIRNISFDQGESVLYFTDVSSNIQTQTVTFKALNNPQSVRVYEQNFQRNLVNTQGILKKFIEKQVTLYVELASESKVVRGTLLGYNSGYIIKNNFGVSIFNKIAGIEFPSLPQGFFTLPTLNWKVYSTRQQTTPCQVAYRTTGFSWKADYSISLNSDETKADIGGWVTIDNNSGKKYINAKLKLITGDVNTVSPYDKQLYDIDYEQDQDQDDDQGFIQPSAPEFSSKSFADYHLYTLDRPVTLNESSQKQVQFIPKVYGVDIDKYHQIRISSGGYNQNNLGAQNYIRFFNSQNNSLGIPFPKGIFRAFKTDEDDGSLEFIGEDKIQHTPKNENITIYTGNAFDITADKQSISRRDLGNSGYEANLNMTVKNHKQTSAKVVIIFDNYYGDNLEIGWDSQLQLEKVSSSEYKWTKILQPNEEWFVEWNQLYTR